MPELWYAATAYSVTSTIRVDGSCAVNHGSPIQIDYTYLASSLVEAGSDLFTFERTVADELGLTCSTPATTTSTAPTAGFLPSSSATSDVSTTVASPAAAASSAQPRNTDLPNTSVNGLSYPARIGVIAGVLLGGLVIAVLALLLWRSERRRRRALRPISTRSVEGKKTHKRRSWTWGWFPYLQQKGELDAEGQRKNELDAAAKRHEMSAEGVHQLPVDEQRQELKDEGRATEMEVSVSSGGPVNA